MAHLVTIFSTLPDDEVAGLLTTVSALGKGWTLYNRVYRMSQLDGLVPTKYVRVVMDDATFKEIKRRYNPRPGIFVENFGLELYQIRDQDYPRGHAPKRSQEVNEEDDRPNETFAIHIAVPPSFSPKDLHHIVYDRIADLEAIGLIPQGSLFVSYTQSSVFINVHRDFDGPLDVDPRKDAAGYVSAEDMILTRIALNGLDWKTGSTYKIRANWVRV